MIKRQQVQGMERMLKFLCKFQAQTGAYYGIVITTNITYALILAIII